MTDREIANEIIGKLLESDVQAFERTITDAENTVYHVLQQVNSVDLADVGGSLLRETTMRANLALPENDQDLKWFDETCDHKKSGDFMERLFDELKLGKQ